MLVTRIMKILKNLESRILFINVAIISIIINEGRTTPSVAMIDPRIPKVS